MLALILALQQAAITSTPAPSSRTLSALRVEYAAGATEPPGNHGYDVVLVPIDEGMTAELEGEPVKWAAGLPILISRGAPHRLSNESGHRVRFIEVRTIGDNPAGTDAVGSASQATIVRSVFGKYVRATVWRFERRAHVEWPAAVDALVVHTTPPGGIIVNPRSEDNGGGTLEVVRISRKVGQ